MLERARVVYQVCRVFVPEDHGGGFITLKCNEETTASDIKSAAIAKIRAKRLQCNLTGNVELDFQLVKVDDEAADAPVAPASPSEVKPESLLEVRFLPLPFLLPFENLRTFPPGADL